MKLAGSIMTALAGYFVDMSLLRAEPLPLLSVIVGTTLTLLRCSRSSPPEYNMKATNTASASKEEIISDGFELFSKIQGHSSPVVSIENHSEE